MSEQYHLRKMVMADYLVRRYLGVPLSTLRERSKKKNISQARHLFCYIEVALMKTSVPDVSLHIRRGRNTVKTSVQTIHIMQRYYPRSKIATLIPQISRDVETFMRSFCKK
jgi:chromosomal replication initiation ATPase DnaA